jgi:hypothetical protein
MLSFIYETNAQPYNYDHVNVTTRANITNAGPEIMDVLIDQSVTLNAGANKTVYCNATIRDWNGWDDVVLVNATFFHSSSTHESLDDGNTHYTNASCVNTGDDGNFLAYYSCGFEVIHYANNGTWTCNVTAEDTFSFTDSLSNTTTINALFALNVTDTIDYGDLAVTETSANISAFITNFGNVDINVSVLGYGAIEGDGLGLVCTQGSNITVENQRFGINPADDWTSKVPLSSTNQDMSITLLQPTDLTAPVFRETFWQLYVPPNPFGLCTGTVRFTATAP